MGEKFSINYLENDVFSSDSFFKNPHPYYHDLRTKSPIYWYSPYDSWVVTSYDDIISGLKNPVFSAERLGSFFSLFPSEKRGLFQDLNQFYETWLMFTDPPIHETLKKSVINYFSPRHVKILEGLIKQESENLLKTFSARSHFDVINSFSAPISISVLSNIMGIPETEYSMISELSSQLVGFLGSGIPDEAIGEKALNSLHQLKKYLSHIFEEKSKHSSDDIITSLIQSKKLSEEEMFGVCANLLVDGHEPVSNAIANGIYTFLSNPDQLALLQNDMTLLPSAVEEILRYEPPFTYAARQANEDTHLRNIPIKKGQIVMFMIIAANRDLAHFSNPDTFNIGRENNKHLTFGYGNHFCLGAFMGRFIISIALESLLNKKNIELSVPAKWKKLVGFRALDQLIITSR